MPIKCTFGRKMAKVISVLVDEDACFTRNSRPPVLETEVELSISMPTGRSSEVDAKR